VLKTHKCINKLNNKYSKQNSEPMVINGKEITNDKLIANQFNSFYANQYTLCKENRKENKTSKQKNLTRKETQDLNTDIFNEEFIEPELEEAIKSLKVGRAAWCRLHFSGIY
jgi:hypothetical protein